VIVDSALYRQGVRTSLECSPSDFATLRSGVGSEGDFVWLGLYEPTEDELAAAAAAFGLHQLAVEDAFVAHQRPKLERYGDMLFLVLKSLWYVDESDAVETGEVLVFMGRDFVVTVRHGEGAQLAPVRSSLEAQGPELLSQGPSAAVYGIADQIVDAYTDVVVELTKDADEVEASVFDPHRKTNVNATSERIYALKREIAEVRRAVLPLREPIRRFAAGEISGVDPDVLPFFRDVHDHLTVAAESVDSLDQLLSSAFAAHMAQISAQQNDDMRKISAGAALIVVPTFIAGVYGMNFRHMPELGWHYGYAYALLLMLAVVVGLAVYFRKSGWF